VTRYQLGNYFRVTGKSHFIGLRKVCRPTVQSCLKLLTHEKRHPPHSGITFAEKLFLLKSEAIISRASILCPSGIAQKLLVAGSAIFQRPNSEFVEAFPGRFCLLRNNSVWRWQNGC